MMYFKGLAAFANAAFDNFQIMLEQNNVS